MTQRVLTEPELNRAMLARQGLIEPFRGPIPKVLDRIGGIQAQYAPSMYVGLWSRTAALERDELTAALERRRVVVATLMRVTIHLVSAGDFWPLSHATAPTRRVGWLRNQGKGLGPEVAEAAAAQLDVLLRENGGTLRQADMDAVLGKFEGIGARYWRHLLRVPPSSTWARRRADLYADARAWLGAPDAEPEDLARAGRELLVRRYLGGFGPASPAEIANFAGLPQRDLAPVLDTMTLRRFRNAAGETLLDLPRAPLPAGDTPVPVRFLPTWDATLLVHARRTGILREEHRKILFTSKNPQSLATFLVDGVVEGWWRHEDGRIVLEPFGRLDAAARRALEHEAERLAAFLG